MTSKIISVLTDTIRDGYTERDGAGSTSVASLNLNFSTGEVWLHQTLRANYGGWDPEGIHLQWELPQATAEEYAALIEAATPALEAELAGTEQEGMRVDVVIEHFFAHREVTPGRSLARGITKALDERAADRYDVEVLPAIWAVIEERQINLPHGVTLVDSDDYVEVGNESEDFEPVTLIYGGPDINLDTLSAERFAAQLDKAIHDALPGGTREVLR